MEQVDVVRQILELARSAGPFGAVLMFFMWYRSDKERIKLQGKFDEYSTNTVAALAGVKEALRDMNQLLAGRKPHG